MNQKIVVVLSVGVALAIAESFPVEAETPLGATLTDIDSGTTSPQGQYRWMDVADQIYRPGYQDDYDYTQAAVEVEFLTGAHRLHGTITSDHLKPHFAYQLKLVGFPGTESNEPIGLTGRWWEEEWDGSAWSNGRNLNNKGDGSSPNPNDLVYFARRDIPDPSSPTGKKYRYTGYLLFDYFITDASGVVVQDFEQHSSYHVLWKTSQTTPTAQDGPLQTVTYDVELPDPVSAYDFDYPEQTVSIFGEWERLPPGAVSLPPGQYEAELILTEESFHGGGLAGGWAAAVGATVSFSLTSGPVVESAGSRYIAIRPPPDLPSVALRVDAAGLACLPRYVDADGYLVDEPVFRTSDEWGTIFAGDEEMVPSTTYQVRADVRTAGEPENLTDPASVTTADWGDANDRDGANVFDILCVLDGSRDVFTHCSLTAVDLMGTVPNRIVDAADIMAVLDAFRSLSYADAPCSN